MTVDEQAQATDPIAKAARRLLEEAVGHMRLARQHRKRARTLYAELKALREECSKRGIRVELPTERELTRHIKQIAPIPPGGTSGNQDNGA